MLRPAASRRLEASIQQGCEPDPLIVPPLLVHPPVAVTVPTTFSTDPASSVSVPAMLIVLLAGTNRPPRTTTFPLTGASEDSVANEPAAISRC